MGEVKISETLKELRVQSGLTQDEFSKKLNVARQTYSAYERGVRRPDVDMICRTAELHNVSLDWLILGKSDDEEADPFASLPEDAGRLCRMFYTLSPERQRFLMEFAEYLEQKEKGKKG